MKLNPLAVLAAMSIVGVSQLSEAKPYRYSDCDSRVNIKHPAGANDLFFNKQCTVAYVLPPKLGNIVVGEIFDLQIDRNICSAIDYINSATASDRQTISHYAEAMTEIAKRFKEAQQQKTLYTQELRQIETDMVALDEAIIQADEQIATINGVLSGLQQQRATCPSVVQCRRIDREIQTKNGELQAAQSARRVAAGRQTALDRRSTRIDTRLQSTIDLEASLQIQISELRSTLEDLEGAVVDAYKERRVMAGAQIHYQYSDGQSELLAQYRALNRGQIAESFFQPMQVTHSMLNLTTEVGSDFGTASQRISMPATTANGTDFRNGQFAAAPSSGSFNVEINQVAACGLMTDNGEIDLQRVLDTRYLSLQNLYEYEVAGEIGYSSRFNVAELYERIQTSGSRGGFFSRRRYTSVTENSEFDSSFDIRFFSDSGSGYTDELKQQIIQDEKEFAVDQLFKEFLALSSSGGQLPVPQLDGSPNGAQAASAALSKCPNLYCQVGAALLGVADAIWGSSKATSHFRRTREFEYNKTVRDQRMFSFRGATGYVYQAD